MLFILSSLREGCGWAPPQRSCIRPKSTLAESTICLLFHYQIKSCYYLPCFVTSKNECLWTDMLSNLATLATSPNTTLASGRRGGYCSWYRDRAPRTKASSITTGPEHQTQPHLTSLLPTELPLDTNSSQMMTMKLSACFLANLALEHLEENLCCHMEFIWNHPPGPTPPFLFGFWHHPFPPGNFWCHARKNEEWVLLFFMMI